MAKTEGNPVRKFCCRYLDWCAPPELLEEGRFLDRIAALRHHYKEKHPSMWGKGEQLPAIGDRVCDKYTGTCGRVVSILNDEVTIEPTRIKRGARGKYLEVTEPPIRAKIANLEPDHIRRYEELKPVAQY